jgi:hypothetical protein
MRPSGLAQNDRAMITLTLDYLPMPNCLAPSFHAQCGGYATIQTGHRRIFFPLHYQKNHLFTQRSSVGYQCSQNNAHVLADKGAKFCQCMGYVVTIRYCSHFTHSSTPSRPNWALTKTKAIMVIRKRMLPCKHGIVAHHIPQTYPYTQNPPICSAPTGKQT